MIKVSFLIALYEQDELILKMLDTIPRRDDIEVLLCDDASRNNAFEIVKQYKKDHPDLNLKIYRNETNRGVSYTRNKLMGLMQGEYYYTVDDDDYLFTDAVNKVIDMIDGEYDVYYVNIEINDGTILVVDDNASCSPHADYTKFVRSSFAKGLKNREDKSADGDWYYHMELLARHPTITHTGITTYHYNYPRTGSLVDLASRGLL